MNFFLLYLFPLIQTNSDSPFVVAHTLMFVGRQKYGVKASTAMHPEHVSNTRTDGLISDQTTSGSPFVVFISFDSD